MIHQHGKNPDKQKSLQLLFYLINELYRHMYIGICKYMRIQLYG